MSRQSLIRVVILLAAAICSGAFLLARPSPPLGANVTYSTYLGGSGFDYAYSVAIDAAGSVYIAGQTDSVDFPATRPPLGPAGGTCGSPTNVAPCFHVFVAKLDPTGSSLVYATILGGSGEDHATGIAVDADGAAYVTGYTASTDFPTTHAFQATSAGGQCGSTSDPAPCFHAFVAKLDPTGSSLVYSTYLGGAGNDIASGIAVDATGAAYVVGSTSSSDFPVTAGAIQSALNGGSYNAFVTKLDPTGESAAYSTYLGGSGEDHATGIAVGASGQAVVAGYTNSFDFPTMNPLLGALGGGTCGGIPCFDAFVSKLNETGSALVYSTYVGGSGGDYAHAVALDLSGNVYLAGVTTSTDFPVTSGAVQAQGGGTNDDAFVAKLRSDGSALIYSTYLGGNGSAAADGITVDSQGNAFVTGSEYGNGFPLAAPLQSTNQGLNDAFAAKLNAAGSALIFSTYLGGSGNDVGQAIAIDTQGNAYVVGGTFSADFPVTPSALKTTYGGGAYNAFAAKISDLALPVLTADQPDVAFPGQAVNASSSPRVVTLTNKGDGDLAISGITASGEFAVTSDCGSSLAPGASCSLRITVTPTDLGPCSGTIAVVDNAWGSPLLITLEGLGIPVAANGGATVSLSSTSLSFGGQNVLTSSPAQSVTLTNAGTATLVITAVAMVGDFSDANTCGTTVTPGATCTLPVTFTPAAMGARTGTLLLADNAADSPQTISLAGMGTAPAIEFSSANLAFGDQGIATTSAARTIHLTNRGTGPLTLTGIKVAGDYGETNACTGEVAAGASCDVAVTFSPTAAGTRTGTLMISDCAGSIPQTIALSGNGVVAFSLGSTQGTVTVPKGTDTAEFNVSVSSSFGFSGAVTLACSGVAPAVCSFAPASVIPGLSSTLTVDHLSTLPGSSLAFTVSGTNGAQSSSTAFAVLLSDFALSASPVSATVHAGQSAVYTVSVTPSNSFNQAVSLVCSGAPFEATCSVSPGTVPLDGSETAKATITVTTTARSQLWVPWRDVPGATDILRWLACLLAGLLTMSFGKMASPVKRPRRAWLGAVLCFALWCTNCGGGGNSGGGGGPVGTPAGTYTLTVSANSPSNISHSITLTLVVN